MNARKANNTIGKIRQLQRKLYLSAKGNNKRKFHALYDKVSRMDILEEAWKRVKSKDGVGGIDGQSIADIEACGVAELLKSIQEELQTGRYHPQPVLRVFIPKGDGKERPLGIPVIKDRIVQMAAKIVVEPIFEADFKEFSYGFRPKRNQLQALTEVKKACNKGGWWVVDADIKGYFDNINHEKLMKLVEMRINDRRMLKLIRLWLKAGVMVDDVIEKSEIGSPQGGVISPLLANIYLHYMDTVWEKQGKHLGKLIRFCDDFVIVCRSKKEAEHALKLIKGIMQRLELTLHPEKTKLVHMWDGEEGFDFLGMHHRRITTINKRGQKYTTLYQFPSKKAMKNMGRKIWSILSNRATFKRSMESLIEELNPKIRGWSNYYGVSTAKEKLRKIDFYILEKFTIWYNKKRNRSIHRSQMSKVRKLLEQKGLLKLVEITHAEGEECRKAG